MKRSIIILFLFLIVVLVVIYFAFFKGTKVTSPAPLSNIPKQAKWIGGADGGNWYEVSEVKSNNTFKIKIYNEGNGEIEADTTFVLSPDCFSKKIDSLTLMKSIDGFDGEKILLNIDKKHRCTMIMK